MRTIIAVGLLFAGCASDDVASAPSALSVARDGEIVLDERADGAALFGRLEEALPDSDHDRVLVLRSELDGQPFAGELDGARVLDARFADGGIVAIGADHVLRFYGSNGASELDAQVQGPLSVAGSVVAYARGEMPDFEIVRADVRTGAVVPMTEGMAPAWSPALSSDGREVIFVSSIAGSPRLYRTDGSAPRALPRTPRFPTAPVAPRWEGNTLRFEDEIGATSVDLGSLSLNNPLSEGP